MASRIKGISLLNIRSEQIIIIQSEVKSVPVHSMLSSHLCFDFQQIAIVKPNTNSIFINTMLFGSAETAAL